MNGVQAVPFITAESASFLWGSINMLLMASIRLQMPQFCQNSRTEFSKLKNHWTWQKTTFPWCEEMFLPVGGKEDEDAMRDQADDVDDGLAQRGQVLRVRSIHNKKVALINLQNISPPQEWIKRVNVIRWKNYLKVEEKKRRGVNVKEKPKIKRERENEKYTGNIRQNRINKGKSPYLI